MGLWLETIGNFIVLFAAIFATLGKDKITPGLAGLSVSYALQVSFALNESAPGSSDILLTCYLLPGDWGFEYGGQDDMRFGDLHCWGRKN